MPATIVGEAVVGRSASKRPMDKESLSRNMHPLHDLAEWISTHAENLSRTAGAENEEKVCSSIWKPSEDYRITREVIIAAGATLKQQANKIMLVCKNSPKFDECESVCQAVKEPCETLQNAVSVLEHFAMHDLLVQPARAHIRNLFRAVTQLCDALLQGQDAATLASYTGVVWEKCDNLEKLAKSGKIAGKRKLLQVTALLKDIHEEVLETADSGTFAMTDGHFEGNEWVDDEGDALDEAEIEALKEVARFVKNVFLVLRAGAKLVPAFSLEDDDFEWRDNAFHLYVKMESWANELEDLYGLEHADGLKTYEKLATGCQALLALLLESQRLEGSTESLETMGSKLAGNLEFLREKFGRVRHACP